MTRDRRLRLALPAAVLLAAAGCAPVYSESAPGSGTVARPGRGVADERAPVAVRSTPLADVLGRLVWPLATDRPSVLSSRYGVRVHPRGGDPRFHNGLDLRAPAGTPVYAAADGVVMASGAAGAYGLRVVVDHGAGLRSLYAHHSRNLVRPGERVRRGQPIALVGRTGNATGDHLHFELRWGGGTVDPRTVLPVLGSAASAGR